MDSSTFTLLEKYYFWRTWHLQPNDTRLVVPRKLEFEIDSCVMFHFSLEKPKGLHVILWKGLLISRVPLSQLTSGINEQCFKDH